MGMNLKKYICPECGSRHTQRCEMVYQQGVSTGFKGETRISALAQRAAPPVNPRQNLFWSVLSLATASLLVLVFSLTTIMVFLYEGLTTNFMLFIAILSLSLYLLMRAIKSMKMKTNAEARREYESDLALYERLWLCRDCGHIFEASSVRA